MRAGGELLALFVWMAPHTPMISNTRNIISYKRGAQFRMRGKKGTADAEALVLLPADGVG